MPFQPPPAQNLGPLLLQHTLNQRAQEEARVRADEAQRKELRRQEQHQLFQLAQNPDLKLDAFAPLFHEIGPEDTRAALEIQKAIKKQRADTEQAGQASSPQNIESIATMLANPILQQRGGEALQQSIVGLQSRPDLLPFLMQQVGQGRDINLEAQRQGAVAKQDAQKAVIATENRATGRTIATENRVQGRGLLDQARTGIEQRVAEQQAVGTPIDWEALKGEVSDAFGMDSALAGELVSAARFRGGAKALEIQRTERGQQGKQPAEQTVDDKISRISEQFPDYAQKEPAKLRRDVRLAVNGGVARDAFGESLAAELPGVPQVPRFVDVQGKLGQQNFDRSRQAQREAFYNLNQMESALVGVQEAVARNEITPEMLAVEGWTGLQEKLGTLPPAVALLKNGVFQYSMAFLSAMQGARSISDRDVINALALGPSLQEMANSPETAISKVMLIRGQLVNNILSDSDPELRKILQKDSNLIPSALEKNAARRARGLMDRFNAAQEKGDTAGAEAVANELTDQFLHNEYSGISAPPPPSKETEKFMQAHPEYR